MCWMRIRSSGAPGRLRGMQQSRLSKDLVTEVAGEIRRSPQVDGASEDLRKLHLHTSERDEARCLARQELDQHIDVAARRKILAKHAAKQAEPRDRVPPTEVGDLGNRRLDGQRHHAIDSSHTVMSLRSARRKFRVSQAHVRPSRLRSASTSNRSLVAVIVPPLAAGEEVAEGAQAPWVSVGLVVVRHGGRRARCLYPCISAMETRVFRIGGECFEMECDGSTSAKHRRPREQALTGATLM